MESENLFNTSRIVFVFTIWWLTFDVAAGSMSLLPWQHAKLGARPFWLCSLLQAWAMVFSHGALTHTKPAAHQMWVTKWLWFFVNTKTILEVFNRFSLSIFTYCYCWSIFKWKRSAEKCRIAADLVKWDISFHSFLFLVLCCEELFSQCKEIWGCLHGEVRGMIPSEVCQEIMSAVMGLSMCASNTQCFTRAGKGWQKRRKWQWYNGNMPHKASIRAA